MESTKRSEELKARHVHCCKIEKVRRGGEQTKIKGRGGGEEKEGEERIGGGRERRSKKKRGVIIYSYFLYQQQDIRKCLGSLAEIEQESNKYKKGTKQSKENKARRVELQKTLQDILAQEQVYPFFISSSPLLLSSSPPSLLPLSSLLSFTYISPERTKNAHLAFGQSHKDNPDKCFEKRTS